MQLQAAAAIRNNGWQDYWQFGGSMNI